MSNFGHNPTYVAHNTAPLGQPWTSSCYSMSATSPQGQHAYSATVPAPVYYNPYQPSNGPMMVAPAPSSFFSPPPPPTNAPSYSHPAFPQPVDIPGAPYHAMELMPPPEKEDTPKQQLIRIVVSIVLCALFFTTLVVEANVIAGLLRPTSLHVETYFPAPLNGCGTPGAGTSNATYYMHVKIADRTYVVDIGSCNQIGYSSSRPFDYSNEIKTHALDTSLTAALFKFDSFSLVFAYRSTQLYPQTALNFTQIAPYGAAIGSDAFLFVKGYRGFDYSTPYSLPSPAGFNKWQSYDFNPSNMVVQIAYAKLGLMVLHELMCAFFLVRVSKNFAEQWVGFNVKSLLTKTLVGLVWSLLFFWKHPKLVTKVLKGKENIGSRFPYFAQLWLEISFFDAFLTGLVSAKIAIIASGLSGHSDSFIASYQASSLIFTLAFLDLFSLLSVALNSWKLWKITYCGKDSNCCASCCAPCCIIVTNLVVVVVTTVLLVLLG